MLVVLLMDYISFGGWGSTVFPIMNTCIILKVGCSYGLCSVGCGIVQLEVKERNGELKNQCKNN
jgi:hypothetical protein